ncbi:MAG: hypothetical protein JXN10_10540, partial [Clostridia bacterium]|nr:hypothetical protein [Clostridia bacterium]
DTRIVDVAMPGAHDAFTSDMNILSPADKYADSIMKGFTGFILKGFLLRQSVTQITDVTGLLENGVRYLDIRLTYNDGMWVTKHNFVSADFNPIAGDLVRFLQNYKGEFLVLDFQHINGVDYNSEEDYRVFMDMLEETGLLDFHHYNAEGVGAVTYGDITDNRKSSQVVIIDKFNVSDKKTYDYGRSIRSSWADDDNFERVLQFLKDESILVNDTMEFNDSFKVMQAVTTMQLSLSGILDSLKTWSLLERASDFNDFLLNKQEFESLIETMPIVMIDYCNTNENRFIDELMSVIIIENSVK